MESLSSGSRYYSAGRAGPGVTATALFYSRNKRGMAFISGSSLKALDSRVKPRLKFNVATGTPSGAGLPTGPFLMRSPRSPP